MISLRKGSAIRVDKIFVRIKISQIIKKISKI